jgi:3-oxoacyl-[acyl-carrier protein] reductase
VCAVASSLRPDLGELEVELKSYCSESFVTAADVASDDEVRDLFADIERRWGRIDTLVNNAGVVSHRSLDELDAFEWDRVLNVNLGGVYRACRAALPLLDDGGSIINITSAVANVGMAGRTHYTASKAGIVGFTRSLCKELGSHHVRVNAIAPGIVDTDQVAGLTSEQRARYEHLAALGRLGRPEDIARAAVFFAADYSSFVTGAVLVVDGGI